MIEEEKKEEWQEDGTDESVKGLDSFGVCYPSLCFRKWCFP